MWSALALAGALWAVSGCGGEDLAEIEGYHVPDDGRPVVVVFFAPTGLDVTSSVVHEDGSAVEITAAATVPRGQSHLMDRVCQTTAVTLSQPLAGRRVIVDGDTVPPDVRCPPDDSDASAGS